VRSQQNAYYGGSFYGGGFYRPNNNQNEDTKQNATPPEDPFPEFSENNNDKSDNFFN
jgi:hypothetical protein